MRSTISYWIRINSSPWHYNTYLFNILSVARNLLVYLSLMGITTYQVLYACLVWGFFNSYFPRLKKLRKNSTNCVKQARKTELYLNRWEILLILLQTCVALKMASTWLKDLSHFKFAVLLYLNAGKMNSVYRVSLLAVL